MNVNSTLFTADQAAVSGDVAEATLSPGTPVAANVPWLFVTVAPNQRLSTTINGALYVFSAGAQVKIPAFEYPYLWRDGVVNALVPNQINGVNVL